MTGRFTRFAAIDWSGAKGAKQAGLAVATCEAGSAAPVLVTPPGGRWSRPAVLDWLAEQADAGHAILIGLDLSPALPFVDEGAYFPGWPGSPPDAKRLWTLVDEACRADPHLAACGLVGHAEAGQHFRHAAGAGRRFAGGRGRLRECERRQLARKGLSPSSCFNLVGAAQVGKSSLTGMRVLARLNGAIPVWPFDPVPAHGPVIVEIYTTIAALDSGRPPGRAKMRDAASLDAALAALGTGPHAPLPRYDDHATDALVSTAWLRRVGHDQSLWRPSGLDAVAETEGWTFGVP